jgi:GTP1/Obg family GTP-binding protein
VSDENLEKFAKASIAIQAMSPQYEERLKNAKTPEEGNQIQLEATEAVSKEVEKQGMSFEEFTTIAMQLESSPELQQRLTQKLQGMQE